jgi:Tfp pilus assembly protein PilN
MRAVNLIPAEQRSGAGPGLGRSGGAAYAVLGLVGALALLAVLYGSARHEISSRRAQAASLAARAQSAQEAASKLAPYTSFVALRQQREQAVSELVDTRFDWAHVLHEFGRVLPSDTSISSLSGTVGSPSVSGGSPSASKGSPTGTGTGAGAGAGAAVTSATPPGDVPVFTLAGCATSQAAVAQTLERLRLIDGVSEATLQSSTKSTSSGAGSSSGCPVGGPTFTVQVNFDPLPTPNARTGGPSPTTAVSSVSPPATTPTGGTR